MATQLITIDESNLQRISGEQSRILRMAQELQINDSPSYMLAWDIAKGISNIRAMIVNDFAPSKDAAYKAHRAICDQEKKYLDKLAEPDRIVRGKITAYNEEQERIAREQERIARDKAEKEAEERRLQEAIKAEAQGRPDVAQKILDAPAAPVAITLPRTETPRISGGALPEKWYFEIVDARLVPDEYKTIDESKIRKVVQALKENATIPGVRVFSRKEPRIGGRKQPTSEPTSATAPVTAQASGEDLWG